MKKLLNKRGFTIVEIIVTLAVLGIVIGPLMAMFITSQKINNEGSKEYKSIQLSQQYMEEIKGMEKIDELSNYNTSHYNYSKNGDGSYDIESLLATESPYVVKIEIKPVNNGIVVNDDSTVYGESIKITNDSVIRNSVKVYDIINNNVDMSVTANKEVVIGTDAFLPNPATVKIILESDVTLNFMNNKKVVEFYIDDKDGVFDCSVNVFGGVSPKVFSIRNIAAKGILYNIVIKVDDQELVNSTKIFK